MKLIYTHENRLLVSNIQNILDNAGIAVTLKNEYAAGASGDLSFLNTWLEVWVINDEDYEKALIITNKAFNSNHTTEWVCTDCKETNDASFDLCWNCQKEHTA
ncbi:MAG: DUF2007 domain-containing protein [Chitinophagaceae bacterium]|nr:MAG: DUF2007 domain-containing protein [Chitinophagaceae bacterium]